MRACLGAVLATHSTIRGPKGSTLNARCRRGDLVLVGSLCKSFFPLPPSPKCVRGLNIEVGRYCRILYVIEIVFAAQVLKKDQKRKLVKLIDERILALGRRSGAGGVVRTSGGESVYEECAKESAIIDQKVMGSHDEV